MYEFGQILGDSEDREALCAAVHGVAESSHYWANEQQQKIPMQRLN